MRSARVLRVEVCDDGQGLAPGRHTGMGLTSIRERADELGGTISIAHGPTGGTQVRAVLPCQPPDATPCTDQPSDAAPSGEM